MADNSLQFPNSFGIFPVNSFARAELFFFFCSKKMDIMMYELKVTEAYLVSIP